MQIGIVGLPNSTKTTIFNALTHSQQATSLTSSGKVEINLAVVKVPDPRVETLRAMFDPRKTTYAQVQFNDIAGLRVGLGKDGLLAGELLNALAASDAFLHVVRAFEDQRLPHPQGSVDPGRDFAALEFEFLISDLQIVERRLERLAQDLGRKGSYPERTADQAEHDLLLRVKTALEAETPLRSLGLSEKEARLLRGYRFLTAKPVLVAISVGDEGDEDPAAYPGFEALGDGAVCIHGALEMEIAQLAPEDAEVFLAEYGIAEPGLNRMIRLCYRLLGLQSFFTVGEDEVKAWTVPQGATALQAAGAIHTDLERGFIRAEVVGYQDLVDAGSLAEARRRGTLRLEGRDYQVQDGDILNIRFNV